MTYAQRTLVRSAFASLAGLSLIGLMAALPARAEAQTCTANSDCPTGTTCQKTSVPSAEPGCAGPDCPAPAAGGAAGVALVAPDATRMACAPAPCTVDSDCGGQMVCHTETIATCSGGTAPACGRDMKCDPVPTTPPTCTEVKVSACAYKWQQPCNAAADCGDGFTCEPTMITSCSGSAPVSGSGTSGSVPPGSSGPVPVGAGGSPGSTEPSDAPARVAPAVDGGTAPMCTTTSSFPGWCRPTATTCNTDADCPAAWTCVDGAPSGVATDTGSSGSGAGGGSGATPSDGNAASSPAVEGNGASSPAATLVAKVKVCQSPVAFPTRGDVATDANGSKGPAPSGGGLTSGEGSAPPVATHGSNAGCSVSGGSVDALAGLPVLLLGLSMAGGRLRRMRRRG